MRMTDILKQFGNAARAQAAIKQADAAARAMAEHCDERVNNITELARNVVRANNDFWTEGGGYPEDEDPLDEAVKALADYIGEPHLGERPEAPRAKRLELETEIKRIRAWVDSVHVALQDPTRPRQSIGEMVAALLDSIDNPSPT
jgi:hypothetical protein